MNKLAVIFMTDAALTGQYFAQAAPLLEPVVTQAARGEFVVADIERMTTQGRAITALVTMDEAPTMAMTFEFLHYPQTTSVNILALGGSHLGDAADMYWKLFRSWCKDAGATVIEASCSPAMARMLRKFGFDVTYQVVRSAL